MRVAAARDGRADPVPVRHARAAARRPGFRRLPRRRGHARVERRDLVRARAAPTAAGCPRSSPASSSRCGSPGLSRSYSLSAAGGAPDQRQARRRGAAASCTPRCARATSLEVGRAPGRFTLDRDPRPRPSCCSARASARRRCSRCSTRSPRSGPSARCGGSTAPATAASTPSRAEVRALLARLPNGRAPRRATAGPSRGDRRARPTPGPDRPATLERLGVPLDAAFHLCGSTGFVRDLQEGLRARGATHLRSEAFGGAATLRSGPPDRRRRPPRGRRSRSRGRGWTRRGARRARCSTSPRRAASRRASGCRVGSCHGCRTPVLAGRVRHDPEPLDPPPPGCALLCCARPEGDVVLDA